MAGVRTSFGIWVIALLALSAVFGQRSAEAATKVRAQVVEFDVRGTTPSEVAANLIRRGARAGNGAIAITSSSYWMDITPAPRKDGCAVGAVTITTYVVINTPRMADAVRMEPKVRRVLTAFARDVLRHERGHQSLKVAAGQRMEKEIRSLPPQGSCMEVRQKAQAVIARITRESHLENLEYDKREHQAFVAGKWAFSSVR